MDNQTDIPLEEIRKRAYEIYKMRCDSEIWGYGTLGTPTGDFLQAERMLKNEYKSCQSYHE
jgi:hypothetical protein